MIENTIDIFLNLSLLLKNNFETQKTWNSIFTETIK